MGLLFPRARKAPFGPEDPTLSAHNSTLWTACVTASKALKPRAGAWGFRDRTYKTYWTYDSIGVRRPFPPGGGHDNAVPTLRFCHGPGVHGKP